MSIVRAFVALESSGGVASKAAALIERLRAVDAKVNWVNPETMHWTLKFLGDVNLTATAAICQELQSVVAEMPPFDVHVSGLGAFPHTDRPRTIWLGVDKGEEQMERLVDAIDERLAGLGYKPEGRRFKTHLTIGRVRSSKNLAALGKALEKHADFVAGPMEVDELTLYSSYHERQGPRFEALCRAELGGEQLEENPTEE